MMHRNHGSPEERFEFAKALEMQGEYIKALEQ